MNVILYFRLSLFFPFPNIHHFPVDGDLVDCRNEHQKYYSECYRLYHRRVFNLREKCFYNAHIIVAHEV